MKFTNSIKPIIKRLLIASIVLSVYFKLNAQDKLPGNAIQVIGGFSKHGSGDYEGIVFGTDYIHYHTKKLSLTYSFRGTINDGKETIIVNNTTTGTRTDASVRFTTAGVQLGVNGGLSIIRSQHHELMLSIGAFGRYQSASNGSDGYTLYYPQATGQPTVLVGYDNKTDQNTYAFGGIGQLHYNYTFKSKFYIGILGAFQNDTNGDVIPQAALSVGRRL
jgi:hypothetical protein